MQFQPPQHMMQVMIQYCCSQHLHACQQRPLLFDCLHTMVQPALLHGLACCIVRVMQKTRGIRVKPVGIHTPLC
jgi:hypothetical protein